MRRMYTQEQIVGIIEKSNLFAKKLYRHHISLTTEDLFHLEFDIITENSDSYNKNGFQTYMSLNSVHVLASGIYISEETPLLITELYNQGTTSKIRTIKLDGSTTSSESFSISNWNNITYSDSVSRL